MFFRNIQLAALRLFSPLLPRKKLTAAHRRFPRHSCNVPAMMSVAERGYGVNGLITEVSQNGLRFREASNYILDRRAAKVSFSILGQEVTGSIMNVSPTGYGIRLDAVLDAQLVSDLVEASA